MKELFLIVSFLLTNCAFGQKVDEIVENYNQSIDPYGKLDSFTHLQVDIYLSIFNSMQAFSRSDTVSQYYSIFGENSYKNWSDGIKVDVTQMVDISEWERKNVLKIHINFLICDNDESLELVESTDTTYVIEKLSPDKKVHYEINRESYDLIRKTIISNSKEMTSLLFDYQRVDGIKVATRLTFESEMGTAEQQMFNYKFYRGQDVGLR
ncbi:hypothetical protein [Ekhidna sp.]|uniref:hypothetical protein n=1 Tax=Ekhidna sp. TaxID=2608089 RepID=UPI003514C3EF